MSLLFPQWDAPASVHACSTMRQGGFSLPPWDSFNLGMHVGDDDGHVLRNRQHLIQLAGLPSSPVWLEQVHGTSVLTLPTWQSVCVADAAYTRTPDTVCAVMTADCLPVLLCSQQGDEVAAVHAGWRGLLAGVIEQTLKKFAAPAHQILAWLGPAIGPGAFEVGAEVRNAFIAENPLAAAAFAAAGDKFYADLWLLARQRLSLSGITTISGGGICTYQQTGHFFSYRRDGITGRMATLIWLS
ncbi:hypothetical protein BL250_15310 [Erwinia sp. OLTSP20]|uniref:purine nucleoside phosphorylase YfiH n=1 Tax=unclassified Erwinia TaxID=2622719 RepID=UPI000C18BC3D|nr:MULTISPECIES: purine nucleoside phosphorylase YfiH [unclassified Erwinia]PIJ50520.1 hypothetical protein BV501_08445 [Erwinia sp. OAMSP11]PIJ72614.1 hypothetical protein BK416_09045 [Erwinia sp. OLSSP12]PIJ82094.1 hypothetical protein BLD47_07170 [Erwinia sp. OLCASP19]PIJ84976.1 hypothetical protein BLD46_07010 [Erwinia sp. OLMTSP26]PIJ86580.1 hypothetical protein BLD49_08285 [Erwinia sp. OLMDSP33]